VLNRFAREYLRSDFDALGIRLVGSGGQSGGQPSILDEADEFLNAGLVCGLFADNEKEHSGRRATLRENPLCAFGSWSGVRNIEEAVATWLPWNQLPRVLDVAAGLRAGAVDHLLRQVGQSADQPGTASLEELRASKGEDKVRDALAIAMQSADWFKSLGGGAALGELLLQLGLPPEIERTLRDFWDRVRRAAQWE
jgi:hypothetical protein